MISMLLVSVSCHLVLIYSRPFDFNSNNSNNDSNYSNIDRQKRAGRYLLQQLQPPPPSFNSRADSGDISAYLTPPRPPKTDHSSGYREMILSPASVDSLKYKYPKSRAKYHTLKKLHGKKPTTVAKTTPVLVLSPDFEFPWSVTQPLPPPLSASTSSTRTTAKQQRSPIDIPWSLQALPPPMATRNPRLAAVPPPASKPNDWALNPLPPPLQSKPPLKFKPIAVKAQSTRTKQTHSRNTIFRFNKAGAYGRGPESNSSMRKVVRRSTDSDGTGSATSEDKISYVRSLVTGKSNDNNHRFDTSKKLSRTPSNGDKLDDSSIIKQAPIQNVFYRTVHNSPAAGDSGFLHRNENTTLLNTISQKAGTPHLLKLSILTLNNLATDYDERSPSRTKYRFPSRPNRLTDNDSDRAGDVNSTTDYSKGLADYEKFGLRLPSSARYYTIMPKDKLQQQQQPREQEVAKESVRSEQTYRSAGNNGQIGYSYKTAHSVSNMIQNFAPQHQLHRTTAEPGTERSIASTVNDIEDFSLPPSVQSFLHGDGTSSELDQRSEQLEDLTDWLPSRNIMPSSQQQQQQQQQQHDDGWQRRQNNGRRKDDIIVITQRPYNSRPKSESTGFGAANDECNSESPQRRGQYQQPVRQKNSRQFDDYPEQQETPSFGASVGEFLASSGTASDLIGNDNGALQEFNLEFFQPVVIDVDRQESPLADSGGEAAAAGTYARLRANSKSGLRGQATEKSDDSSTAKYSEPLRMPDSLHQATINLLYKKSIRHPPIFDLEPEPSEPRATASPRA